MKRKPFIYAGRGIVARLNEGLRPIDTDLEKEYVEAFRSLPKEPQRKVVLLKKRKR